MTITYGDLRQHSSPAEQLRRGSIPSDPRAASLQHMAPKELVMRGSRRISFDPAINPQADLPHLFESIEGLLTLSPALDPRLDHPPATYVAAGRQL